MKLAVVVPCRDRLDQLSACLRSVEAAIEAVDGTRHPALAVEVVVVSDRSAEGFGRELRRRFPRVTVLRSGGAGPGAARNTALRSLLADGYAFTDSDCRVARDWLAVAADWFAATSGPPFAQGIPWLFQGNRRQDLAAQESRLYELLFSSYVACELCTQTDTRNLLLRGPGPGQPALTFPTSMDMAAAEARVFGNAVIQGGHRISWLPTLRVYHEDPPSLAAACRQKYRHGSGRVHVWSTVPPLDQLLHRYFHLPVAAGIDPQYVIPAHLAFLSGYRDACRSQGTGGDWWFDVLAHLHDHFADVERHLVQAVSALSTMTPKSEASHATVA